MSRAVDFADRLRYVRQDSQPDPNVSSGTCYFASGLEAGDNFIPCGNSAFGFYTCCQAGDNCISADACFNYRDQITYLASCTDPSYSDPSCPNKGSYGDQQWSGIVQCDPDAGTWANCQERPGAINVADANPSCSCAGRPPLFTAASFLPPMAQLPLSVGGTISWYSGYAPPPDLTPTATPDSTPTSIPPSTTADLSTAAATPAPTTSSADDDTTTPTPSTSNLSVPPSTTPNSGSNTSISSSAPQTSSTNSADTSGSDGGDTSPSSQGGSTLSTGSKIGIGVGTAAAALLLIALIAFFFTRYRRRARSSQFGDNDSVPYGGAFDAVPSSRPPVSPQGGQQWSPQQYQQPYMQQMPYDANPQSFFREPAASGIAAAKFSQGGGAHGGVEPPMLDGTPVSANRKSELPGDSAYYYPVSTASPVATTTTGAPGTAPGSPSPPSTVDYGGYGGPPQQEQRGYHVVNPDVPNGSPH